MGFIDTAKRILGLTSTYENPQSTYWTLDQLKTAVSPRVGLEAQLDRFTVTGELRIDDSNVPYAVAHQKSSGGWRMHVSADTPQAHTQVESIVKSFFAASMVEEKGEEYIVPRGNLSTSEVVETVAFQYPRFLAGSYVAQVRFKGKSTKDKADKAGLKLERTQI